MCSMIEMTVRVHGTGAWINTCVFPVGMPNGVPFSVETFFMSLSDGPAGYVG
jgi:hypothetical protein